MLSSRLRIDALRIAPKVVNVKMGKQIIMQQAAILNIILNTNFPGGM